MDASNAIKKYLERDPDEVNFATIVLAENAEEQAWWIKKNKFNYTLWYSF